MSWFLRHRLLVPRLLLAALAMPAVGSAPLAAQTSQTGLLHGRVTVAGGAGLPNATVTLRQTDGSYPRATTTDERGDFRINFVTPGTYTLQVRLLGYRPVSVTDVLVRPTEPSRLAITLEATATELAAVTVTASAVTINRSTTEITSSLGAREREMLPTPRSANQLVAFTPGVRPGQVYGGSTAQANLYQLDGVTVNQPGTGGSFLLPSVDWIQDLKVIGLGAGAEYGNFQGGLINIVTKSGSNTFQGHVRTFIENRALNASNVNAFENGSEQDTRTEINAEVRGPLVRDRLYYYLSGQESRTGLRVVDFQNSTNSGLAWLGNTTDRREQKYYGKLTWQASTKDIVNASFGVDNVLRERVGLNGYDATEATYRGTSPSTFYQANWLRTFSARNFLELKFSGYSGQDNELPYSGMARPAVLLLDENGQFANATFTRRNAPSSYSFTANYDAFFNTGALQHNVKIGGDYGFGLWRERRTRNGGLTWYTARRPGVAFNAADAGTWGEIPSIGNGVYATADTGGRVDLDADSRNAAAYIQDYIRISDRLSVNAGVRLGYWAGFITPGNGGGAREGERFRALSAIGTDPRVGIAWDITGRNDLVIKAHWGRFHQNLFSFFFDRAPGANVFTNVGFCDWTGAAPPDPTRAYAPSEFGANFRCGQVGSLFNEARDFEGYRQPYLDQMTFGLEKALGRNLKAQLLYINRVNKHILALVDRNLAQNWRPLQHVQLFDANGPMKGADGEDVVLPTVWVRVDDLRTRLRFNDQIPGYTRADTARFAPSVVQDLVLRPVDEARRRFDQVQAVVEGAYDRWSFNASLAYTSLTGNLFSVNGYFDPNGQGNGPFVDPNGQVNYQGNLENSAPWDMKVRTTASLPWKLEGGAFFNVVSGDFWTPTATLTRARNYRIRDQNGALIQLDRDLFRGAAGQAVFIEPRGNRQLELRSTLDVRVQRVVPIRGVDLLVGVEIFNVYNDDSVLGIKTTANNQIASDPTTLIGAVRLRQQPTTFRLNTQIRF